MLERGMIARLAFRLHHEPVTLYLHATIFGASDHRRDGTAPGTRRSGPSS
jgi:hypothetical protein